MATHSLTDVPEQTHDAMQAAASRPVSGGPASTPVQAASGGLEVPGGELNGTALPSVSIDAAHTHEPIPGERDASTLTHREVGAMGAGGNGELNPPEGADALLDQTTRRELVREGGGLDAERRFDKGGR